MKHLYLLLGAASLIVSMFLEGESKTLWTVYAVMMLVIVVDIKNDERNER
jgi:hypothetical protein